MNKKIYSRFPFPLKTGKRFLSALLSCSMAFSGLALGLGLKVSVLAEETYSYSTKGGNWIPVEQTEENGQSVWKKTTNPSNNYALDKDKDGTFETDSKSGLPLILLQMNGSEWTYSFVTDSSGNYSYYVMETMKGDQAAAYQLVDENGNEISAGVAQNGSGKLINRKTIQSGNLTLQNRVEGDDSSDTRFRFDLQLGGDGFEPFLTGTRTFGATTFVNGKATIYLNADESVTIPGLPAGIGYTVTEIPSAGYSTSWNHTDQNGSQSGSSLSVSDEIEVSDTDTVIFTNRILDAPAPSEVGRISISNQVINKKDGDDSRKFPFMIALSNLRPNTTYTYQIDSKTYSVVSDRSGMAQVNFELKDGETAVFQNLPLNSSYQIIESGSEDYTSSFTITGTGLKTAQGSKTNTDPNTDLTTAKETLDKDEMATIAFTNKGPGRDEPQEGLTDITVQKIWDDNKDSNGVRPESLTIYLLQSDSEDTRKEGDIVSSAMLTAADYEGSTWSYTFTDLPTEDENGNPYYYYAAENKTDLDEHYKDSTEVSSDGQTITITNTYALWVSLPESGQAGILLFTTAGLGAIGFSVMMLVKNKKKQDRSKQK